MTYKQALKKGYVDYCTTWQRGYVSRKTNMLDQKVLTAGGKRHGEKFVLCPTAQSTQYCIRQYIKKQN